MNVDQACDRYVELALSYDGCDAETDPWRFGRVVCPNGPEDARAFFCRANVPFTANSSCEAAAAGIFALLCAELGLPCLTGPFVSAEHSWADLVVLAKTHGAYFSPESPGDGIPVPCIVHVEGSFGRHWWTGVRRLGEDHYLSVDGGKQTAKGFQAIGCVQRQLRRYVYDLTSGKPVADWIDVRKLLAALLPAEEPSDAPVEG